MTQLPTPRSEQGSIPLALLVIIALTAVLGALVATVVGGTRQVRFDEDYTTAIQVADTGAQEGAAHLMDAVAAGDLACDVPSCPTYTGTGTTTDADGRAAAYSWSAQKVSSLRWQVTGTATVDGVSREVVIDVADRSRFFLAAFSDRGFRTAGGNGANSFGESAWYTGNGIVASNANIEIRGSTEVDGVHLFNWRDDADFDRCRDDGGRDDCADVYGGCPSPEGGIPPGRSCTDVRLLPEPQDQSLRFDDELEVGGPVLDTAFIDDQRALCPQPIEDYTTSAFGGGSGVLGTPGSHTVYCFDDVTINDPLRIDGTVDIYVYGDLLITEPAGNKGSTNDNRLEVNCDPGCTVGTSVPDARKLTFYVDGSDDPADPSLVQIANQASVVAGIYAPESSCEGSPSNAQADIFGSLICGTITNQGGWGFHFDDRLKDEGIGEWQVRSWREQTPDTPAAP